MNDPVKVIHPTMRLAGTVTPPGDKSISHRAVMLGALAEGKTTIKNFLMGEDCLSTIDAFRGLGIRIDVSPESVDVYGQGMHGLKQPEKELYLGNSGTTTRLLLGILAGQPFISTLTGDDSLAKRPMKRVTVPLREMGAKIQGPEDANFCPITIKGGELKGIKYIDEIGSAQVKSAILFAGLFAEGETEVKENFPSRDHTERMFKLFGASFKKKGKACIVQRTEKMTAQDIVVPSDISSAAFFIVAALLVPGSDILIRNVILNPTRTGILEVLKEMGADITFENLKEDWEPVGDIRVRYSRLKAVKIKKKQIPFLIDELPILMLACAVAEGKSEIRGAAELRVKETDRIKAMCANLAELGVKVKELPDGCTLQGGISRFKGASVDSFGDHRVAMCMAVAGLQSEGEMRILGSECVTISYPQFFEDLRRLAIDTQ